MVGATGMSTAAKIVADDKKRTRLRVENFSDIFESGDWTMVLRFSTEKSDPRYADLQRDLVLAVADVLKHHGVADTTSGVECYVRDEEELPPTFDLENEAQEELVDNEYHHYY